MDCEVRRFIPSRPNGMIEFTKFKNEGSGWFNRGQKQVIKCPFPDSPFGHIKAIHLLWVKAIPTNPDFAQAYVVFDRTSSVVLFNPTPEEKKGLLELQKKHSFGIAGKAPKYINERRSRVIVSGPKWDRRDIMMCTIKYPDESEQPPFRFIAVKVAETEQLSDSQPSSALTERSPDET